MSDDAAPKPEDQDQQSPTLPPVEQPTNKRWDWPLAIALLLLFVGVGLLLPAIGSTRPGRGATQSAKQVEAEREQQIQEALRLANESESIP